LWEGQIHCLNGCFLAGIKWIWTLLDSCTAGLYMCRATTQLDISGSRCIGILQTGQLSFGLSKGERVEFLWLLTSEWVMSSSGKLSKLCLGPVKFAEVSCAGVDHCILPLPHKAKSVFALIKSRQGYSVGETLCLALLIVVPSWFLPFHNDHITLVLNCTEILQSLQLKYCRLSLLWLLFMKRGKVKVNSFATFWITQWCLLYLDNLIYLYVIFCFWYAHFVLFGF
jgi:hypothetical protein